MVCMFWHKSLCSQSHVNSVTVILHLLEQVGKDQKQILREALDLGLYSRHKRINYHKSYISSMMLKPLLFAEHCSSLLRKLKSHIIVVLIMRWWREEGDSMPDRNSDKFGRASGVVFLWKRVHLTLEGSRGEHKRVSAKLIRFSKLSPSLLDVIIIMFLLGLLKHRAIQININHPICFYEEKTNGKE